jgi:hypothetical protein
MSNVAKAGPAAAPSPGAGRPDAGERAPKAGEFEAVLREKGQGAGPERAESPARGGQSQGRPAEGRATEGRASDRASTDAAEGRPARGPRDRAEAPSADRERGEAGGWRALPGDVAVPTRAEPGSTAVVESSRAADAVARVERIAEQIVCAVEVRLGDRGSAEVRLELDLGGLGQLRVALHRDAEGTLAVRFDRAGPEASRLLVDQGGDLVARLEAKGLALREVVLAGADGSLVRIGSPSEPAPAEPASRLPDDAARTREQASSRQPEDQGRRGRRVPSPVEEEEEE